VTVIIINGGIRWFFSFWSVIGCRLAVQLNVLFIYLLLLLLLLLLVHVFAVCVCVYLYMYNGSLFISL
jgi:hypothetical protein